MTYDKDSFLAGLSVGMSLRYSKRIPPSIQSSTEATFVLTSNLTQTIYFTQSSANGVTIDWGDGSATETKSALVANATHTYNAGGMRVVRLTAANGVTWHPGGNRTGFCGPLYSSTFPPTVQQYYTLTRFLFGNGCTLGAYSFAGCASLVDVEIPSGATSIPTSCFRYCKSLKSISIPDSVEEFGEYAFAFCTNLLSVVIPNGVTDIPNYCFSNCASLQMAEIPSWIQNIETRAFENCESITISVIPTTVQTVGANAFYHCSSITEIEVGCKTLGYTNGTNSYSYAFQNCTNLVSAWLRSSIVTIYADSSTGVGGSPFQGCDNLNTVYCEPNSKPSGWGINFAKGKTVVYGQTTRPW